MRRKSGPVESQAYEYAVRAEDDKNNLSIYLTFMKKRIKLFRKSYFLKVAQENSSENIHLYKDEKDPCILSSRYFSY